MNFLSGTVKAKGRVHLAGLGGTVTSSMALPGAEATVTVGPRRQHLHLTDGNTHRVTEALGGVNFIHLSAPEGEALVREEHDDSVLRMGDRIGPGFDGAQAMIFADSTAGLRIH